MILVQFFKIDFNFKQSFNNDITFDKSTYFKKVSHLHLYMIWKTAKFQEQIAVKTFQNIHF